MAMNNRLLRPRQNVHPDAADWANRVRANGGTASGSTLNAVSRFCSAIAAAGIRDRFYRLNLFCGTGLEACLVPLYRGQSLGGTQYGNAADANNGPFVSADYNETGVASGLKANGTNKFLNTGVAANLLTASDAHLGFGLRATQTGAAGFKTLAGAYNNSTNSLEVAVRRNDTVRNCIFSRVGTSSDQFGDQSLASSLGVGDLVAAWPTFYRNGVASGAGATTSQNYPLAHSIYVFALNQAGTAAINHTDARMNWYSIGLTMTAAQVLSLTSAVAAFNSTLSRT